MWDQKYPFAVLLIFAHIFKASCMGSGSLTFAIDDTGSMGDDIDQVKRGANRILDIVFNEKSSAIDNMVLVSINEPISEVRAITTDRYTFRQALDALEPHDTILNDCPEPSMTGTLLALEKSHPDSYIYVFTDASAKDSPIASQVMELCQRKQSQINFILTGVCDNRDQAPGVNVYYDVAAACSGLAFFVGPESLNPVIRTIEETINGNKTVMVTTTVPSGVITKIRFTIDDRTEYAVVYVAGSYVSLTISGSPAIIEDIMRNHNGIVVKVIKETAAGDFVATVRGARSTSVIIVGRTDFLFDYGFSKLVPKSLADTTSQPIANSDVYLSILINDPGHLVKITTAYILGMNENIISSLPLNQISTDFYITNPFTTPSEKIQIVVEGIVISTGKIIRRMSKIPITPQKPIKVEIDTMDPVVNIEEGERTEVEYDGTVKLTCKVSGYPKPEIIWTDSRGATVKSVSSILQVPYDYISYVTISNIKKGDRFECNAVNNKASDAKIIDVVVKDAFEVKSIPQGTIRVHYGSSGIITCDITSKQPMNIRWYYEDDKTRRDREIFSSNTYKISADGKQLIIKKMYLKTVGKYTCKATLTNHNDVQKIFSTRVTADGLVAPVASGEKSQKATKGSAAHIHCNVKGYPKPVISWQFKGAAAQNFVNLGNHGVYRIPSVQENHAGYYKCVAVNVIGSAAHVTTLIVQDPPKITTIHTDYYKSKEGAAVLKMPCDATGIPKPSIIWKKNGATITPNSKYSIEAGALIIKKITVEDASSYTCEASNEVGAASATFKTIILQAPRVFGVGFKEVTLGTSATIECKVFHGIPLPNITWQFKNTSSIEYQPLRESDEIKWNPQPAVVNVLKISNLSSNHSGRYKCVATNELGTTEHITFLIVQSPPKIISTTLLHKGVEGDIALRIPCTTTGEPIPTITWKVDGAIITPSTKYAVEDGALVIHSPTRTDSKSYTCEANNVLGTVSAVFQAQINDPPKITTIHTGDYKSKEGAALLKMPCDVTGIPKPSIIWKKNGATITPNSKYSIEAGALIIKNVAVEDASSYTCEASNEVGAASATFKTIILQTPRVFGVGFKEATLGTSATIECKVFHGIPLPNITWQFKNTSSIEYQPLRESDEIKWNPQPAVVNVLKISNLTSNHTGRYKCVATNELGTTEHITLLIVQSPPKIISTTLLRKGVEGDIALRIPCTTTGEPIPTITWKVDGAIITPNTKYAVEDGALVIRNPIRNDSKSYTCEANNVLGTDSAVFKVKVNEYVGYGDKYKVFIKEGENRKLYCDGHNSNSQTVRWLVADVDLKLKEPYLYFEKATVDKDGNYTCRVSDKHGNTFTHTYVVDVGRPPKFKYANLQTVDWRGDVRNVLSNCDSEAKPLANTTWYFDGKMLSDNDLKQLENRFKWGRYSCNVFNVHGSIQRSFEVASPECYINKNVKDSEDTPLILNSDLTWPSWKTPNNHYLMKPQESIKVFCPGQATTVNEFQTFNTNSLQATCVKQDIFEIDGKNYVLKDLRCKNNVTPSIRNEKSKCLTETSEMIRVGYEVKGLLGTYDVCFDYDKNVPLYTRALLSGAYDTPKTTNTWHKYPVIADEKLDKGMACKDSLSSCCYSRTLLVNDRIFNERQARDTTFIKPLNTILQWRPCTSRMTTWENINDMVRTQIQGFGKFYVWSGTHTIQEEDGAYIPRYLWMVLKFNEENNLAIVHVNAQTPTDNDIKCRNTCNEDQQPWFTPADKFTYCCRVDEFLAEFNLKGHGIGA
ncbi:unnamed protein product [Chrysodeixis includens]|uniref:Hemolin n=1 Tax=Chrysodeixis includens TaxID=689277 RepID=A0A9P0FW15_CHRIL|nr:unnamed protein product [Chrysodeixis includens]